MRIALPPLEALVGLSGDTSDVAKHLQHNVQLWRWINGAFGMLKDETLVFDTQQDYWYRTDRRIVAAYLHRRLRESYYPAADLRALAQHLFRHFEGKVAAGGLGAAGLVREAEWPEYRGLYASAVRDLPNPPEYGRLKARWKRLTGATLAEDVLQFLRDIEGLAAPNEFEPDFFYRMQWLPYVGQAAHGGELARWQRLFFAFYTLFASTNAFTQGGALSFAPILQNNPLQLLLGHARRWANGERPDRVGFRVETKWEEKECSHYIPVAELFGFLNLDRYPYYNGVSGETYAGFVTSPDASAYDSCETVGAWTAQFLAEHSEAERELAARFRARVEEATQPPWLWMEGVRGSKSLKQAAEAETRVDAALQAELGRVSVAKAREWTDRQAAAALLHLTIDAFIYLEQGKPNLGVSAGETVAEAPAPYDAAAAKPAPAPSLPGTAPLPEVLRAVADEALGFLKDGHHVLLAGAPGTGKTTVAQWVAHAWNAGADRVPAEAVAALLAPTTVANSAWSPFHTIGGLVATTKGGFEARKGFFIGKEDAGEGRWRLRPECVVLDEMNRADLDRCIGELYPLLTRSVAQVEPAGIPGVESIDLHERFRIVATVNDASIDDIVFPISEGLARRFVRIEMHGASEIEVTSFVCEAPGAVEPRATAATGALSDLFRLAEEKKFRFDGGDTTHFRIPLGVGYFAPLRSWVAGGQALATATEDAPDFVRARRLVALCLGPARRNPQVRAIQKGLMEMGGESS